MGPKKIIIDTDPGTDDAVTIFMAVEAARHGEVEILAITCVHGNSTLDHVTRNTLRILKTVDSLDIPVYVGAHSPLVTDVLHNPELYHGVDGFGDYDKWEDDERDSQHLQKEHAANALIRLANENAGEISLIAIGPLTNLALAMKLDPTFTSKLKEISIMGGNVKGVGNVFIAREFNFYCDPDAAFVVMENVTCPTYIFPWETCCDQMNLYDWRREFVSKMPTPQVSLMNKAEGNIFARKDHDGRWFLCDPVCLAIVIDKSIILDSKRHYVTVERQGQWTSGMMLVDHLKHLGKEPNVIVLENIDMDKMKQRIMWAFGKSR